MSSPKKHVIIRNTTTDDFPGIIELCRSVYPSSKPWRIDQLESHLRVFPQGQFVAIETNSNRVVGMAGSLIVRWDDYQKHGSWREFTAAGMFTNHDPKQGMTLYGAEVMVDPTCQRCGIGSKIYAARRELCQKLKLRRIRAAARLRGYHRYADKMTPDEYTIRVIQGKLKGPTLSFQLKNGFEVVEVIANYLQHDPESLGYAAIIEWINPEVATQADIKDRDPKFIRAHYPDGKIPGSEQ